MTSRLFSILLALCLSIGFAGCSKDNSEPKTRGASKKVDPMLATVPAETNYFANIDLSVLPDALKTQGKAALTKNAEFKETLAALKTSTVPSERFAGIMLDAIITNYLDGTMAKMGMSNQPRAVLYGLGMWPAVTVQIDNQKAFESWLNEQEKAAKISAKIETLNQKTYRICLLYTSPSPRD